jgi:redox-sensitive bicupin YhaK (pirin superfamily)
MIKNTKIYTNKYLDEKMNIIRRSFERRHIKSGKCDMWLTFYPQEPAAPLNDGFGNISILNEVLLDACEEVISKSESESELITYVHKGTLALEGLLGYSGVITAGEYQCMVIARITGQRVTNISQTDLAHFFRIYLRLSPSQYIDNCLETPTRFTVAQRRNILCKVASPEVWNGSIRINSDAHIYSSILDPGQHIVHELLQGRKVWLHIVYGKVRVYEIDLNNGDGIGITEERSISFTVLQATELLLIDVAIEGDRSAFIS